VVLRNILILSFLHAIRAVCSCTQPPDLRSNVRRILRLPSNTIPLLLEMTVEIFSSPMNTSISENFGPHKTLSVSQPRKCALTRPTPCHSPSPTTRSWARSRRKPLSRGLCSLDVKLIEPRRETVYVAKKHEHPVSLRRSAVAWSCPTSMNALSC
jgi:hypothetical protein